MLLKTILMVESLRYFLQELEPEPESEPESEPVKKIPGAGAGQKQTGSTTLTVTCLIGRIYFQLLYLVFRVQVVLSCWSDIWKRQYSLYSYKYSFLFRKSKRNSAPDDIPIRLAVTFAPSRARVMAGLHGAAVYARSADYLIPHWL